MFFDALEKFPNFYKSISILSESSEDIPRSLVKNGKKLLSGDDFCKECRTYSPEISQHCSVDGLKYYYTEKEAFNLVLIEFKFFDTDYTNEQIKNLKMNLKLKALETVFCILPHIIKEYDKGNEEILIEQLIKTPKIFFFVTDHEVPNKTRSHRDLTGEYFDTYRLKPHPFVEVKTLNILTFETFVNEFL